MKINSSALFKKYLPYLFVIIFIFPCPFAIGETKSTPWLLLLLDDKNQQGETKAVSEEGGILIFKNAFPGKIQDYKLCDIIPIRLVLSCYNLSCNYLITTDSRIKL